MNRAITKDPSSSQVPYCPPDSQLQRTPIHSRLPYLYLQPGCLLRMPEPYVQLPSGHLPSVSHSHLKLTLTKRQHQNSPPHLAVSPVSVNGNSIRPPAQIKNLSHHDCFLYLILPFQHVNIILYLPAQIDNSSNIQLLISPSPRSRPPPSHCWPGPWQRLLIGPWFYPLPSAVYSHSSQNEPIKTQIKPLLCSEPSNSPHPYFRAKARSGL